MKQLLFRVQVLLFIFFTFFLLLSLVCLFNIGTVFNRFNYEIPVYNGKEEFDPSLKRLTSISKLEVYCDSLYDASQVNNKSGSFEKDYSAIAVSVVKKKFFHGYSHYGYSDNYLALMLEPATGTTASAIVVPDDIMKYSYAACSQQSLVMMELLRRKEIMSRKVKFNGGNKSGSHFCFEAYYNNSWHFFDTNLEPDKKVLEAYSRPSVDFLVNNDKILRSAYNQWDSAEIRNIFLHYSYGQPNEFEAPKGLVYQWITKFLSHTIWIFFLVAFLIVRKRYLKSDTPLNKAILPERVKKNLKAPVLD